MNRASRRKQKKLAKIKANGRLGSKSLGAPPSGPVRAEVAALFQKAIHHHQSGRLSEAEVNYQEILKLFPEHVDALHLLGVIAGQTGNHETAVDLISKALALHPGHADAHNNLGNVFKEMGQQEEAANSYQKALALAPDNAQAHNNLGLTMKNLGRLDEAAARYRKALSLAPDFIEAKNNLGNVLRALSRLDEAVACLTEVITADPDFAPGHNNLGNALMELGRMNEAAQCFRDAIALRPEYAEAHRQLALISGHTEYDTDIRSMEAAYTNPSTGEGQKMHLAFGLGKAFEDLGRYSEAFDFFLTGNALCRKVEERTIEVPDEFFQKLKDVFSPTLYKKYADAGYRDRTPIFVLGMMRSGTSLIEQILASHSRVHGAGELNSLEKIIHTSLDGFAEGNIVSALAQRDVKTFKRLGSAYISELRSHSPGAEFISDKMPINFAHIGLIKLMLPEATVVHCRRNPMDVCLSIFKNYFSTRSHDYAYDLEAIGRYYVLYDDLMAHWHDVLPGFVRDVRYEDVVVDQEGATQSLLDNCGLDWEDSCMDFHTTDRPVRTASSAQVRRPLYGDSVALWRRYEKQMAPLLDILPPGLVAV